MNSKKVVLFTFLIIVIVFFLTSNGQAQQSSQKTKPPVITKFFAVEKGQYGYIWKIYIEAEDPDGDMNRIYYVIDQPGAGRYPYNWIMIKPQYRSHFKGYIQWNTFSSRGPLREWTYIKLTLSIVDKAGNESNEAVFPFSFESGIKDQYQYQLPAPFNEGNLPRIGYIHTDLFEPTMADRGDRNIDIWPDSQ